LHDQFSLSAAVERDLLMALSAMRDDGGFMNKTNPTTDLLTLIGMMATIAGIFVCLFFLFTPATFGAMETSTMIDRSADLQLSMRWIQPILGQAIVEDALIRQHSMAEGGAKPLLHGVSKPDPSSVQWMLGRVIVELHRSRMVTGQPGHAKDEYRIVTIARHAAQQFQAGIASDGRVSERPTDRSDLVF
jgi:hypothetical protein